VKFTWKRAIAWIICAIVLGFVGAALVKQFRQVNWSQVHFRALPAAAAMICLLGVSGMQLLARRTLLIAYGYPLTWRQQIAAAWVPQLGKYLPGGIASVGGAVYLLKRFGVPAAIGLSCAVMFDGLAVMAGLIVSTPLLIWGPVRAKLPMAWLACIFMTIVGIVLLHPRVFVSMINIALRMLKRHPIAEAPPLRKYLSPVLASFGQWIFAGFALWFMTAAVIDVSPNMLPVFIASAALAMTVSYLTPFAPGGIGVREGLYLLTLGPLIGPTTAVIVLAMRVVQTLIEVVLAGVGMAALRHDGATAFAAQRQADTA
jgi:glycosyltransferase 2 family protein